MINWRWLAFGMALCAAVLVLGSLLAHSQETDRPLHEHGVGGVPDWYDPDCCTQKDCRPVPDDEVEEIDTGVWLHKPTGLVFKDELVYYAEDDTSKNRVRETRDGRFHVCYVGTSRGNYVGYCIYVKRTRV